MAHVASLNKNFGLVLTFILVLGQGPAAAAGAETSLSGRGARAGSPDPQQPISLDQAITLALAANPEMRASQGRVAMAVARAMQARRWSNPELTLAAEDAPVSGGGLHESKNTIGMSQTVPFPGKKRLDGQAAAAGVRRNEMETRLYELELTREVKAAFYRVLASERLVAVARELAEVTASSAGTARKRVEAGAAPDQEQLRAEIQLEQARSNLAESDRELAIARQELAMLLGHPELHSVPLIGSLAESSDRRLADAPPPDWLERHPRVVAARLARDRSEIELKRARLEPYPDVTLGVSGGREGATDTGIMEFRVGLPLPILDTGKGRKREAQAGLEIAQAELAATEQRLLREWGIVTKRFRTAVEQVESYRDRILPKASQALRLVQTGFEEGKFGFIDLIDTQRTVAEARLAYQNKLLELHLAQADLEALLGTAYGPKLSDFNAAK
jgi:cobalt-zinc-cadmium efflux system outer membrane protein